MQFYNFAKILTLMNKNCISKSGMTRPSIIEGFGEINLSPIKDSNMWCVSYI